MVKKLQSLFSNFSNVPNEHELRLRFMDTAGELFEATAWGWKSLADNFQVVDFEGQGLSNTILKHYEELGYLYDPLMCFMIEHHAPVHEQLILTQESWQHSIIYQQVYSRYNVEHLMIGPLIGNGQLQGKVYFTRSKSSKPFAIEDISRLSALCTHLSVCLATLRSQSMMIESPFVKCLTEREQQIANLIAKGLKTAELSVALGITQNSVKQALKRMFIKLNVSTRAQMIAKLRTVSVNKVRG